jgi:hypothetical protein
MRGLLVVAALVLSAVTSAATVPRVVLVEEFVNVA